MILSSDKWQRFKRKNSLLGASESSRNTEYFFCFKFGIAVYKWKIQFPFYNNNLNKGICGAGEITRKKRKIKSHQRYIFFLNKTKTARRKQNDLPKFSAEVFISFIRCTRPLADPAGGFWLPGEWSDWLLCRRIVGNRATNDALCLKLEDARLVSDFLICSSTLLIFFFV